MNKHLLTLCITIATLPCLGMNKHESDLILPSEDQLQRKSEKINEILDILHYSLAKKLENSGTVNNYDSNSRRQQKKGLYYRTPQYTNAQLFIIPNGTLSTRVYLSGNTTNNNDNDDSITKFGLDVD